MKLGHLSAKSAKIFNIGYWKICTSMSKLSDAAIVLAMLLCRCGSVDSRLWETVVSVGKWIISGGWCWAVLGAGRGQHCHGVTRTLWLMHARCPQPVPPRPAVIPGHDTALHITHTTHITHNITHTTQQTTYKNKTHCDIVSAPPSNSFSVSISSSWRESQSSASNQSHSQMILVITKPISGKLTEKYTNGHNIYNINIFLYIHFLFYLSMEIEIDCVDMCMCCGCINAVMENCY